jgi:asparagine synthase (glutamine-hydrolysing)
MCGIAGIYSFKNNNTFSLIEKMTNAMAHRGPDADGFYSDDTVSLGHRRLSIIDLSSKANQPLYDTTGDNLIIFNGEIYNYKEVKTKISHYPFKTNGDTEVVLAAYLEWGSDALTHLKGMFAFAIYNKASQNLFIARDRLGVKPVYYYHDADYFIFASELRAILATGLVDKKIDLAALNGYFKMQSFYTPHTIIEGIKQLPNGTYCTISKNKVETAEYWDITKPSQKFVNFNPENTKKQVKQLLLQSVERRLVSDVPVAAFLSGGIDSSAIIGLMAQVTNAPQTFNIAFSEEEYDESYYAEIIAKKFATQHHKVLLKPEIFLDELPNALGAMDIPSGDGINSYVVSKAITKHGIKVAMSGAGGDELFAGYPSFKHWFSINQKNWIWQLPKFARTTVSNILPSGNKYDRIKQMLNAEKLSIENIYPLFRQIFSAKEIESFLVNTNTTTATVSKNSKEFPILSQYSIAELLGYTQQTLLKDTDQFSMAVSLEVREPFFDHELIEYVLQIPDKIKYPNYPKQLLVESLGDLLPKEIVHRKKKGFTFPWEKWMRNELKEFCATLIQALSDRSFMQKEPTINLWNSFLQNKGTRWSEIWLLVVLENWLQKNID